MHCLAYCWAGADLSLGSPRAEQSARLAPFLLLYSREVGAYVRAGLDCRSDVAYCLEAGRDAPAHEWRYQARLFGAAPRLRCELLAKGLGGLHFRAKGPRADLGLLWRRRWRGGFADLRATLDLNSRATLAPALKAAVGRRLTPYAELRLLLRAGDRPPSAHLGLRVEVGGLPLSVGVELQEAVTVWVGARVSGVRLSAPVWVTDWRQPHRADALFAVGALLGFAAAVWWARRDHRRRETELTAQREELRQTKLQQAAVLGRRGREEEAGVSVLFAAVGPKGVLAELLYAPFPWSAATAERARPRIEEVTATFNFYADEAGLDLPADKTQLLGYLRPSSSKPLHVLVVYRPVQAAPGPPLRKLFEEGQRLTL